MSAPYLLLAVQPAWMKFIPRPGRWMILFKQAMGFVLIGTAVWLLSVLAAQLGAAGVVWTVAFWGFLGLAAWIVGLVQPTWQLGSRAAAWALAAAVVAVGAWFSYAVMYEPTGGSPSIA
jgi:thiol:disulfide interchange protein DsbD